ncbi:MAG: toxin-antitoxin system HicB family antitoxin [Pirellulales bacterium]|nr:toxin-antitoxin system HicB family antitoxin [Pirellulales bacterium]
MSQEFTGTYGQQFEQPTAATPTPTVTGTGTGTGAAAPQGADSDQVYKVAHELYSKDPDWVTFFREVLGLEGAARRTYPEASSLAEFEKTEEYCEIQQMLAKLRERNGPGSTTEPTRVITVRLPQSLHEALRTEAHEKKTSMNKLCISKLLQTVDADLIPADA